MVPRTVRHDDEVLTRIVRTRVVVAKASREREGEIREKGIVDDRSSYNSSFKVFLFFFNFFLLVDQ